MSAFTTTHLGPGEIRSTEKTVCMQPVIITRNLRRGDGGKDPIRIITQVWTLDGGLIAENDPLLDFELAKLEGLRATEAAKIKAP